MVSLFIERLFFIDKCDEYWFYCSNKVYLYS